jgi:DNA mismatch repair protein MutS2
MAILDHFIERGSWLMVTTHHGMLKNYGYSREGVENASVEFDRRTLSPTYRLIMGLPGESRALDIAARNGLPPEVVIQARGYLDEERSDVSALIAGLKDKHRELDTAAESARAEETRLREERRRADLKELSLRQRELDLKTEGALTFRRLLTESRKTLENLVREVKEGELTREKTLRVKGFLKDLEQSSAAYDAALEAEAAALEEAQNSQAARSAEEGGLPNEDRKDRRGGRPRSGSHPGDRARTGDRPEQPIGPGTGVLAGPSRLRGRVLREDKKGGSKKEGPSWIVEIGSMKMSFPEKDLIPLTPSREEQKPLIAAADLAAAPEARFEISLRGMRLEEALDALRRQIDAAVLSGLRKFSVVHGKGDGILQKGVHDFLKKEPAVADYFFSRPELGGFGRTEVVLKEE